MDEYIGMIVAFPGRFVPEGFIECNGQSLPISQFLALYSLIGTTYGGDVSKQIFNVPDLRGRSIIGAGSAAGLTSHRPGQNGGAEMVTLTQMQLPPHNHPYNALTGPKESKDPKNNYIGTAGGNFYAKKDPADTLIKMNDLMLEAAPGGSQPHNNMAPFLGITYGICAYGEYPPRPD
ncbi:phage tail protein [Emticicia sp. 21SJ11W-3]|uniref:phage tail protein n=1 Tax=Emticicia sp. 21SJ11W-3 TaxID=2916755 RepID=UPI0020A002C4|nr:tail fiber protein [Emticicia sp. 21SJ11W-3]UTA68943.1 tail fiber protein [Emticicia sp. 21SJ11W-3]